MAENQPAKNESIAANPAAPITVNVDFDKFAAAFSNAQQEQLKVLTEKLGVITESVKAIIPPAKPSSEVADPQKAVFESTVSGPAKWFEDIKNGATEQALKTWSLNKEAYYAQLAARGNVLRADPATAKTEAITVTAGDMPQIFDKQVFVLPGGRMKVPIRQFLRFKAIPQGADRMNWYTIGAFDVNDTTAEGTESGNVSQTVTKVQVVPTLYRAVQTIGYSQIENAPFGLIEAVNQAALLGALAVEDDQVLNVAAAATAPNLWIRGDGTTITTDDIATNPMTIDALEVALQQLDNNGYDTSPGNVVAFLHPKAVRQLIQDVDEYYFTSDMNLQQRDVGIIERRLGIDIVSVNKVTNKTNTTNNAFRNVVCIKGHTFALASAVDLQVEALRRPELSAVKVGMRHRIAASVFDANSYIRISTTQ